MLESKEIFEAYSIIDLCYYRLRDILKEIEKPKTGIQILIEKSTGYDIAKMKEWKDTSIELLEQIIKAKKIIEADYKNDVKMLEEILAMEN